MRKIDMDNLNYCIAQDAGELDHIPERAFIYQIVKQYFSKVPEIKSRKDPKIMVNYTREEIIKIVLEFYRDLDQGMYEQAKRILTGQSEIPIIIYDKDKAKNMRDELETYPRDPKIRWEQKSILVSDKHLTRHHLVQHGSAKIFVPRNGDISDAYYLAHEISHTFDRSLDGVFKANSLLLEITPDCIENIMDYYLQRKGIITRNAVLQRRIEKAKGIRGDYLGTLARIELATLQRDEGNLDEELINEYLETVGYKLSDKDLQWAYRRIMTDRRQIGYNTRYIVADLITSPYFQRLYEQDPKKAVQRLKAFHTNMKEGTPEESLESLGITLEMKTIDRLLDSKAGYVLGLESQSNKDQKSDDWLR